MIVGQGHHIHRALGENVDKIRGATEIIGLVRGVALVGECTLQIDKGCIIIGEVVHHIAERIAIILPYGFHNFKSGAILAGKRSQGAIPHKGQQKMLFAALSGIGLLCPG